jgi:hypothetical protein
VAVTFASQLAWRSPWGWWTLMVAGLAATLFLARRARSASRPAEALAGVLRPPGRGSRRSSQPAHRPEWVSVTAAAFRLKAR